MTQPPERSACLNCGTQLRGQYCGHCGQRSSSRLISLWELLREAFGDLLEMDSRVWRTLRPLLLKPGLLTKDYLLGRRARYMPPFRTYLVLSILFFVVAFFDPSEQFGLLLQPAASTVPNEIAATEGDNRVALADEGKIPESAIGELDDVRLRIDQDGADEIKCDFDADEFGDIPDWLARRLTPERMQEVCNRVRRDDGKYFLGLLRDNIPVALIVLMPLMALVLKVLYPLSRRYFVEHLLFFLHFHAFFFLMLTLQIVFQRIMSLLPIPGSIPLLAIVAASFYIPVYLYLAMRRVYGQGHLLTLIKYVGLVIAYLFGTSLTLLGAALFALISV